MPPKRELQDVSVKFTFTIHSVSVYNPESTLCYASWNVTSKPTIYVTACRSHTKVFSPAITSIADALQSLNIYRPEEVEKEEKEKVEITHCSGFETYMKAKLRDAPALSEIFETAVQFEETCECSQVVFRVVPGGYKQEPVPLNLEVKLQLTDPKRPNAWISLGKLEIDLTNYATIGGFEGWELQLQGGEIDKKAPKPVCQCSVSAEFESGDERTRAVLAKHFGKKIRQEIRVAMTKPLPSATSADGKQVATVETREKLLQQGDEFLANFKEKAEEITDLTLKYHALESVTNLEKGLNAIRESQKAQEVLAESASTVEARMAELTESRQWAEVEKVLKDLEKFEVGTEAMTLATDFFGKVSQLDVSNELVRRGEALLNQFRTSDEGGRLKDELAKHGQDFLVRLKNVDDRKAMLEGLKNPEYIKSVLDDAEKFMNQFKSTEEGKALMAQATTLLNDSQTLLVEFGRQEEGKKLMIEGKEAISKIESKLDEIESVKEMKAKADEVGNVVLETVAKDERGGKVVESTAKLKSIGDNLLDESKPPGDKLEELMDTVKDKSGVLSEIKEATINFVLQYLPNFNVPPVAGTKESAVGTIDYVVNGISFAEFSFPSTSVDVELTPEMVSINVADIKAVVHDFSWNYYQIAWPHMTGDGTADATINNASVVLKLALKYNDGKIDCEIVESTVLLNQFDVVVHGTKSQAYNILITLFRDRVRLIVQDTLTDTLKEKVSLLTDSINELVSDSFTFLESDDADKLIGQIPDNIVDEVSTKIDEVRNVEGEFHIKDLVAPPKEFVEAQSKAVQGAPDTKPEADAS